MSYRRGCLADRGASLLEYAVVLGLVAVLVGALVSIVPNLGTTLSEEIGRAVCAAFGGEDCGEEQGEDSEQESEQDSEQGQEPELEPEPAEVPDEAYGQQYAAPSGPMTQQDYQEELCAELGLDCENWDTGLGLGCNNERIVPVYEFYADTFSDHPELQWAGMAKLAGGTVYAGMEDLYVLRRAAERGEDIAEVLRELDRDSLPRWAVEALAEMSVEELRFYEEKFVSMQQQIFNDLGWQHHAYLEGGIEEMERLYEAGELEEEGIQAWRDIASGDPERIAQGNESLLWREQNIILQNDYDDILDRTGGEAVMQLISLTSESPVPGGQPFSEYHDYVDVQSPGLRCAPGIGLPCVPIPERSPIEVDAGNLGEFEDRWDWITGDMLPQYQHLLENEPERLESEVQRPLEERSGDYRMVPVDKESLMDGEEC